MGNAILRCLRGDSDDYRPHHVTQTSVPYWTIQVNVGLSDLSNDLNNFSITSQVPGGLSQYVASSKKAQIYWYKKLHEAWQESSLPPRTSEEAARLVVQTLRRIQNADIEGVLEFYGLPTPQISAESSHLPSSWPEKVKFKLHTLPVDVNVIADGDGLSVYVDTADPRESANVPREVHEAANERTEAQAAKDSARAHELLKIIKKAGYRYIKGHDNKFTLARKYRIRLRGIDAPEMAMTYGQESKEALVKLIQGKSLTIHVYGEDCYGRSIGDIYCNGVFIQEQLLKRGFAWHYKAYDQRPEFAKWQKEARLASRGLWALPNPEKPWEWRKIHRNELTKNNNPIQVY
ncbi:probable staphylococcal-like nuclease CAN1 [Typha latifolia]|uniref:probable staphylococcal-like nuclease CAN1 n=1 Tax=Typha latifolia TaxID=4733 RepID=UPI003C2E85EC